ncbi:MAG: CaiB/BaiF CoA-transferase family protein [Pseudomonadota bacterium]
MTASERLSATTRQAKSPGPLEGFRVIELAGIGPGPFAGQMLADMGAEIILVDRPGLHLPFVEKRGKRSIVVDLRKEEGAAIVLDLVKTADALIEGYRPGVAERLGVGPAHCHDVNPALVYGRMTGWGQTGPWAKMAGHDINYLSITGALGALGPADQPPPVPLNLMGDYGGGSMFLVAGLLAAMLRTQKTGQGDIVDAAIVDGVSAMMGIVHSLEAIGQWQPTREANMLDGAAPYYRCYETADGRFMAVGAIEPQFFGVLLSLLEIDAAAFGGQNDRQSWSAQQKQLADIFRQHPQEHWSDLFDGTDACVTPVLTYDQAPDHPHNQVRVSEVSSAKGALGARRQPAAAPRFAKTPLDPDEPAPTIAVKGHHTREILASLSYGDDAIDQLLDRQIIEATP